MKNFIKRTIDRTRRKPLLVEPVVGDSVYRYPMTYDQPCQIDCRVTSCKFYQGTGECTNISPAITLNENGEFVCWSKIATNGQIHELACVAPAAGLFMYSVIGCLLLLNY